MRSSSLAHSVGVNSALMMAFGKLEGIRVLIISSAHIVKLKLQMIILLM